MINVEIFCIITQSIHNIIDIKLISSSIIDKYGKDYESIYQKDKKELISDILYQCILLNYAEVTSLLFIVYL
jgi:hypothetical protein